MKLVGKGTLTRSDYTDFALADPLAHLLPYQWLGLYVFFLVRIIIYETALYSAIDVSTLSGIFFSFYIFVGMQIACIGGTVLVSVFRLKVFPDSSDRQVEISDDGIQLWITKQALYPTWSMHWSEIETLKVLRTCIKIKHIHRRTFYIPLRFFATEDIEWIRNNLYAVWQEQRGQHVEEPEIQPIEKEWLLEGNITFMEYFKAHYPNYVLGVMSGINISLISIIPILLMRKTVEREQILLFGLVVFVIFFVGYVLYVSSLYFWHYKWIGKIRAVVSPEVITVQRLLFNSKSIQQFTWNDMYSIHQTKKTVRIILHSGSGFLLPIQNLSSSEREELVPLFTAKQRELEELQKKQRKQKKK